MKLRIPGFRNARARVARRAAPVLRFLGAPRPPVRIIEGGGVFPVTNYVSRLGSTDAGNKEHARGQSRRALLRREWDIIIIL